LAIPELGQWFAGMPSDEADPMKYLVTAMPIAPLTDQSVLGNLADRSIRRLAG
jgi:hypothetical protein